MTATTAFAPQALDPTVHPEAPQPNDPDAPPLPHPHAPGRDAPHPEAPQPAPGETPHEPTHAG